MLGTRQNECCSCDDSIGGSHGGHPKRSFRAEVVRVTMSRAVSERCCWTYPSPQNGDKLPGQAEPWTNPRTPFPMSSAARAALTGKRSQVDPPSKNVHRSDRAGGEAPSCAQVALTGDRRDVRVSPGRALEGHHSRDLRNRRGTPGRPSCCQGPRPRCYQCRGPATSATSV